jgi:hypothetical protein
MLVYQRVLLHVHLKDRARGYLRFGKTGLAEPDIWNKPTRTGEMILQDPPRIGVLTYPNFKK